MDNLLGLLIFAVIAIVGLLNKAAQNRKGGEEAPPSTPPIEPEDLPETLRRMIYGDARPIPKARPAQPPQARAPYQPPVARPAQQPRQTTPQQRQARPQRNVIVQAAPRTAEPSGDTPTPTRMRPDQVRPAPRPAPVPHASAPKAPKPVPRPSAPAPAAVSQVAQQVAARMATRKRTEPKKAAPAGAFFKSIDEVRRGIVISEILGPPVSMRRT